MTYKTVVIEDEPIHLENARLICDELGWPILGYADNVFDGLALVLRHKPDLVLLDIMLKEGGNGLELLNDIRKHLDPLIVLTTSMLNTDFINRAAQAGIGSYLIKPLQKSTLYSQVSLEMQKRLHQVQGPAEAVLLKHATGTDRVSFQDIYYLSTAGNRYCTYFCKNREYRIRIGLTEAMAELPGSMFIRIHKSYAIRVSAIRTLLGQHDVMLENGVVLPVGEGFRKTILEALQRLK